MCVRKTFIDKIGDFLANNTEWRPSYLCIAGDIVDKGKYEVSSGQAEQFIKNICDICNISEEHVLMAPGNHDMKFIEEAAEHPFKIKKFEDKTEDEQNLLKEKRADYIKIITPYKDAVGKFLKDPKETTYKEIKPSFENYINFRNKFPGGQYVISDNDKIPYPKSMEFLKPLVQYRLYPKDKIVFWELNNCWWAVPYSSPDIREKDQMQFGAKIIQQFICSLSELKANGYTLISLFHQPFRKISEDEYQTYHDSFSVYDTIVELSDICLSGHEHGCRSKEAYLRIDGCRYFSSGAFYATLDKEKDSSAFLLKIDRVNDIVQKRQFSYYAKTFIEFDQKKERGESEKIKTINFTEKALPFSRYYDNTDVLYPMIVNTIFGKMYNWNKNTHQLLKDGSLQSLLFFITKPEDEKGIKLTDNKKSIICYVYKEGEKMGPSKSFLDSQKLKLTDGELIIIKIFLI